MENQRYNYRHLRGSSVCECLVIKPEPRRVLDSFGLADV